MLVLSRKVNQSIMIGDEIEIVLLETKGDTVKFGIKAPRDVKVFRQEIYLAIKAENEQSSLKASKEQTLEATELLKRALQKKAPSQET
jgi:carbon storage regulator